MGSRERGRKVYEIVDLRSVSEIRDILNKSVSDSVVILVGRCSVSYKGRASSETGDEIRLIILKPDGTLLIHESRGRDPLNWQPPGSLCSFSIQDDKLVLRCYRARFREEVLVVFTEIYHIGVARIGYSKDFEVRGVERDLVEKIALNRLPIDPEARLVAREYHTPYGRIDLVYKNESKRVLYLVEVKNERAGMPAVSQLIRYVEYLKEHHREGDVVGVLVSDGVSDEALKELLSRGFHYVNVRSFKTSSRRDLYDYAR
ncbi:MAG: endonuclease NucS [Sulfolobales archaeon]